MSARSFGSLFLVASCAGAALGCYLVSLRVASERAALETVETRIVLAQRDMRMLQTEIGTRGRLSQLERWNAGAFSLSAPAANQFLEGGFELAKLTQPEHQVDFKAPVVLASAPAPAAKAPLGEAVSDDTAVPALAPGAMLHEASLKTETREVPARAVVDQPRPIAMKSADRPVTAARPAPVKSADMPGLAAAKSLQANASAHAVGAKPAQKKSVDKPALAGAKAMTKRVQLAKTDPLAPLPDKHSGKTKDSPTGR
ncbi:MAG: hypothetical protein ACJ8F4_09145 [Sphingomonas sp.]